MKTLALIALTLLAPAEASACVQIYFSAKSETDRHSIIVEAKPISIVYDPAEASQPNFFYPYTQTTTWVVLKSWKGDFTPGQVLTTKFSFKMTQSMCRYLTPRSMDDQLIMTNGSQPFDQVHFESMSSAHWYIEALSVKPATTSDGT